MTVQSEVMSQDGIDRHLDHIANARLVAVDTETTGIKGIKDGRDYLTGISVAYKLTDLGLFSCYFPFRHETDNFDASILSRLRNILDEKPSVYHNLKFDLHSLNTIGISPHGRLFDTLNIAHMINEEWPSKSLDWLSKTLLKDEKLTDAVKGWAEAFGWATVPARLMGPYACKDAELTYRLFEKLWPEMRKQNLDGLWNIESAYCQLLTEIERNGIRVDTDFCTRKSETGNARLLAIESDLGWKPSSPISLSAFLLTELDYPVVAHTDACKFKENCKPGQLCADGNPSFNKKAMEEYDLLLVNDGRSEAHLVAEYRGWQKSVSSLYETMLALISPDGRVRPNFKQHGTVTGRLSCESPNLQQIPRESKHPWNGDAKKSFIAEDGFKLIEFDYSQLEFRLATAYGRDEILLDTFNSGEDVFIPIANQVFGSAERRQDAKTLVYSTLYGAGIPRLSNALGLSEADASAVRTRFRETYPGIYDKSGLAGRNVTKNGYVKYWTGRKRHLSKNSTHKAFNSVIQGGAAELVKRSMLRVNEAICNSEVRMVLTVHDSIVLEIREPLVEKTIPKVVGLMTDWSDFGVKFAVEAKEWGSK